jgi:protein TonB
MNKLQVLFLTTLLSACAVTSENVDNEAYLEPIDLTNNETRIKDYWVISKSIDPTYPSDAARKGITGCVEFAFIIAKSGRAKNIEVLKAVPEKTFNKVAIKSLKKYRWTPADSNTSLNPVLTTIQLDFSMTSNQVTPGCTLS